MSEKVVLPKFDLPGKDAPAVKLLWIVGGLLVLSMLAPRWRAVAAPLDAGRAEQNAQAGRDRRADRRGQRRRSRPRRPRPAEAAAQGRSREGRRRRPKPTAKRRRRGRRATSEGRHGVPAAHTTAAVITVIEGQGGAKTAVAKGGAGDDKAKAGGEVHQEGDDAIDKLLASFK